MANQWDCWTIIATLQLVLVQNWSHFAKKIWLKNYLKVYLPINAKASIYESLDYSSVVEQVIMLIIWKINLLQFQKANQFDCKIFIFSVLPTYLISVNSFPLTNNPVFLLQKENHCGNSMEFFYILQFHKTMIISNIVPRNMVRIKDFQGRESFSLGFCGGSKSSKVIHIIHGQLGQIQGGNLQPDRSRDKLSNLHGF